MTSINTLKIRQNADLINPFSTCPVGEPVAECPFIPFYEIKDEKKQIEQIELIPQEELENMRTFHRACLESYMKGEWNPQNTNVESL